MPDDAAPQHRKPRPRRTLLILIGLVLVIGAAYLAWSQVRAPATRTAARPTPVPVSTIVVAPAAIDVTRTGIGIVTAWNTAVINPQVSGQIVDVPFREGALVAKGDVLVRIDPRPFQAALDQAEAKLKQDQANLVSNQKNLVRDQSLLANGGFSTQQIVDNQVAQVDALKAAIAGDEAAIESSRLNLDWSTITAPFAGIAGLRNVDVGNVVNPATNLLSVTQVEPIAIDFTLPQGDLAAVQAAVARGTPKVSGYDQDGRTALAEGVLEVVNNQIDTVTGTIKLKARFDNPRHTLWPGSFVQVRVVVEARPDALALPNEAVQRGPDGPYVWVIESGLAHMRALTIGPIEGGRTIVERGIAQGDRVVVGGQYRLAEKTLVAETSPPKDSGRVSAAGGEARP